MEEDHLLHWIKAHEDESKSGKTINNLLTPLRQTLNRALRRREIAYNAFEDLVPRQYVTREPAPFHVSEVKVIIPKLSYDQCKKYAQFNFLPG